MPKKTRGYFLLKVIFLIPILRERFSSPFRERWVEGFTQWHMDIRVLREYPHTENVFSRWENPKLKNRKCGFMRKAYVLRHGRRGVNLSHQYFIENDKSAEKAKGVSI